MDEGDNIDITLERENGEEKYSGEITKIIETMIFVDLDEVRIKLKTHMSNKEGRAGADLYKKRESDGKYTLRGSDIPCSYED